MMYETISAIHGVINIADTAKLLVQMKVKDTIVECFPVSGDGDKPSTDWTKRFPSLCASVPRNKSALKTESHRYWFMQWTQVALIFGYINMSDVSNEQTFRETVRRWALFDNILYLAACSI